MKKKTFVTSIDGWNVLRYPGSITSVGSTAACVIYIAKDQDEIDKQSRAREIQDFSKKPI